MNGAKMQGEIEAQPGLLKAAQEGYRRVARATADRGTPDLVLLAARGSSDNAALYARYLFEVFLGVPVVLAAPSVITRYGAKLRYPRTLAIGISQSGAAPDVSEVIETLRDLGHQTLAITNTPGSRLAEAADLCIPLEMGIETSVAATKTFTASMLALYEVVRAFAPAMPLLVPFDEGWVRQAQLAAEQASGVIVRSSPTFTLARGYAFSAAHETALKLMECALIPTKAYSRADFEHGPKALAGPGSAAVAFDGGAEGIAAQGCSVVVPPEPPVPAEIAPLYHVVFGQWLALSAARARGLDPDVPPHLNKVTETR